MNLNHLQDSDLLCQIKTFVQSERDLLVKILHHLREIERRRLFSELGYKSLFDYAVTELRYSEGQASRRIQAMRLLKDLPELESKIASGTLSLSNVQQAQSFFRDVQLAEPRRIVSPNEKLDVLARLENKSVRDGQKELLKMNPTVLLPEERERLVTETTAEVRFLMTDKLKEKLENVRALLGTKGALMSYAELFDAMSDLSLSALEAKHFGKRNKVSAPAPTIPKAPKKQPLLATPTKSKPTQPRYLNKSLKREIWLRDQGKCKNCGSKTHLNYDHIHPVALGGSTTLQNLRLLCFHCNQRASVKIFGHRSTATKNL